MAASFVALAWLGLIPAFAAAADWKVIRADEPGFSDEEVFRVGALAEAISLAARAHVVSRTLACENAAIKAHAVDLAKEMRNGTARPSELLERLAKDARIGLSRDELAAALTLDAYL